MQAFDLVILVLSLVFYFGIPLLWWLHRGGLLDDSGYYVWKTHDRD